MSRKELPIILLTMGEAGGIGPEICVRAALSPHVSHQCIPVIIGDKAVLQRVTHTIDHKAHCNVVEQRSDIVSQKKTLNVFSPKDCAISHVKIGGYTKATAFASYRYIEEAVRFILGGWSSRLVTAPIAKEAWAGTGVPYHAHTEALAAFSATKKYAMIFVNDYVRVVLATRHIPLKDVARNVNVTTLREAMDMGSYFLDVCGVRKKRIGVCSLNPHAGDNGVIGNEEQRIIAPFIRSYRKTNIHITGPVSADTIFQRAFEGKIDLVVALYHDQGIVPLKISSPDTCVNITVGLPFIRTSPGHGTAFDIAGTYTARPDAMISAIQWALKIRQ